MSEPAPVAPLLTAEELADHFARTDADPPPNAPPEAFEAPMEAAPELEPAPETSEQPAEQLEPADLEPKALALVELAELEAEPAAAEPLVLPEPPAQEPTDGNPHRVHVFGTAVQIGRISHQLQALTAEAARNLAAHLSRCADELENAARA